MIKMIGAILVLVSAYALGCLAALKLKEQERWLNEMKLALFFLMGELEYRQMPMPDAMERTARRQDGCLEPFFRNMSQALEKKEGVPLQSLWQQEARTCMKSSPLTGKQREAFEELGICFAETDKETRRQAVDVYLACLEEERSALRETSGEKSYLYRALGMLGGMFLVILAL